MVSKSKNTDIYYTIEDSGRAETKVKGSRFIATASHATTKDEATAILDTIKAEFHDATHNCYAYRLGADGLIFRAADDGEPAGSAGKPMLFIINKHDLSDVIVVVTRYFGGTKLGVGGLARAYTDAANLALEQCLRKTIYKTQPVKVFCTYEDLSAVKKLVDEFAVTFTENYHDSIEIIAQIRKSQVEEFTSQITSKTRGRAGWVV